MSVLRWTIEGGGQTYVFPQNPKEMSSPFGTRPITGRTTVTGKVILTEGALAPVQWQFGGSCRSAQHYEDLRHWVYDVKRRVVITDHFGRRIECALQSFEPSPKRSVGVYWRHDYVIKAVVVSVGAPTVGNGGPA